MVIPDRGAELHARTVKPSVDLATLIDLLTKSILVTNASEVAQSQEPKYRQALLYDDKKQRLRLCTSAVLRRLFSQPAFHRAFDPANGGGFVRDLAIPAYGLRSKVGGCLVEGTAEKLTIAIDSLIDAIDAALPVELPLTSLLLEQPEVQLQQLAKQAEASFKRQTNTANIAPIAFKADEAVKQQDTTVAKVISAVERIEASDYFERMCSAVGNYLHQRDFDEEDVEAAIDSLKAEQATMDSQITRFLNFLDDEALSRVRLKIAFQIMETIAGNARTINKPGHQLLIEYVQRAVQLFERVRETGFAVDLTAHYGSIAEFDLLDYLSRATFYSCLPVWSEWKTQIFEEKVRNQTATSYGVLREVSYRFRINGQRPETGQAAFDGRLDDIETDLLVEWQTLSRTQPGRFCRRLAELIFLAAVIPEAESQTNENLSEVVEQLIRQLKADGPAAVKAILQALRSRTSTTSQIATALVDVLRTKSEKVISQVQRKSSKQFICVKRSIIEWSRLEGADAGVKDLLVSAPQRAREPVVWFKHIEVSDVPAVPNLLFSVSITTEISEHSLVTQGDPLSLQIQRLIPPKLLQICWVPYSFQKKDEQWTYQPISSASDARSWVLPASIHVEYDIETLQRRQGDNQQADRNKQFHAAAIAAFSVLVYCFLWRITQRLKGGDGEPVEFTALMLRLQAEGRQVDQGNGNPYVYGAAQAIEGMLAQDLKIRMQGIVLDNLTQQNPAAKFVKSGVFDALLSAFPIVMSTPTPPAVPKVGLISYATRPCDESPQFSSEDRGHLLMSQSYVATATNEPFLGYRLESERRRVDIVDTPEQFIRQRLVQEEIRYLKEQGCEHIVLLSHSYGSRHLNRAADYNSLLTPKEFLKEISETFSDLTIYTLLRDVFPATRLARRNSNQAAFEIQRTANHSTFLQQVDTVRVRDVIPVYTFATLYVIEEEKRPQSGFCVYFLVSDQRVDNFDWTERPRRHLVDADQQSTVHPCLISLLRGLHFIEAERGVKKGQTIPVLDPFSWITPNTVEAAGEVEILHTRRKGRVMLNYPALLRHVARVLHRRP